METKNRLALSCSLANYLSSGVDLCELFGAWRAKRSSLTDYQTVSRGLDDLIRDSVKLVYVEHSFDLGEDSGQEAKVAASDSNQLCDDLWWELLIREFNAYRGPALLQ
jgi:hypothetical protein